MTGVPVGDLATAVDEWWGALRTAALVGTARRDVPELPALGVQARPGAGREQRVLDAAALGDAVRRAGRTPDRAPDPDPPAPVETLPVAPPHAVQVLELLLTQGPVSGAARASLTRHWLDAAAGAARIAPPRLLPTLLDLGAARDTGFRRALRPVLGARGAWLAARNPDWAWAVDGGDQPDATPPPTDRTEAVAAARRTDPAAGRTLLLASWDTDGAKERAAGLAGLVVGLGDEDESFLETCLDDRAKGVRELAAELLDRLPGSARAARMAARLRPLLQVKGTLRRSVEVALPDDPDPAGARDGLVEPGRGVSRRARWLEQTITGAPLSVWSDLVGGGPDRVVGMLRGENAETARAALRAATAARRDRSWARALLATEWDNRLVALLPDPEREALLVDRVGRRPLSAVAHELVQAPAPWGPELSGAVVAAIGRQQDSGHAVRVLRDTLVAALHPAATAAVERVMSTAGDDRYLHTTLRDVLQFQSLHRSISEAFR
jgi:hypothetical protein